MKSKHLPMSVEEFKQMDHPFGYKAEYWDGAAVLTPREHVVSTRLVITPRRCNKKYTLKPVTPELRESMIKGFIEAFENAVEFCNWNANAIKEYAKKNIKGYFSDVRGKAHSSSVVAIDPENGNMAGLALFITNNEGQIVLDLLYVLPAWQRSKVATAMVTLAVNKLNKKGVAELYSTYHICNESSQKWHHTFGFIDIYDQLYIRLKYSWYQQKIWRCEERNKDHKLPLLKKKMQKWYELLDEEWRY